MSDLPDFNQVAPSEDGARCTLHPDDFDVGRLGPLRAGALDAAAAAAVHAHLADCAFCRGVLVDLRPLDDALTRRLADAAPTRRRALLALGATAAIAAAAAAVLLLQPAAPLTPYRADPLLGGVAAMKSAPGQSRRFVPTSQVRWILRPEVTPEPLPAARVFLVVAGRLVAAPAEVVTVAESGAVVVQASGATLFGAHPEATALVVALSTSPEALEALVGQPPEAAPAAARLHQSPIEYTP